MKRLLAMTALIAVTQTVSVFAADCTAEVQTIEKGKLTVAVYDYPPFTVLSGNSASCQSARNVDPLSASNIHPPL